MASEYCYKYPNDLWQEKVPHPYLRKSVIVILVSFLIEQLFSESFLLYWFSSR